MRLVVFAALLFVMAAVFIDVHGAGYANRKQDIHSRFSFQYCQCDCWGANFIKLYFVRSEIATIFLPTRLG
jgi:hypothetical protein